MRAARTVAKNVGAGGMGIGMSIAFVATMDDVIYGQFKMNILLPMSMVMLRREKGTFDLA